MNIRGRSGLIGLGSVAAPVIGFFVLKQVIGLGPAPTTAGPTSMPGSPNLTSAPPPAPSAEQKAALAWLASQKLNEDLGNPLEISPVAVPVPEPAAATPPASEPAPRVDPFEGLRLSAVLAMGEGQWASINGKVHRVGDSVRLGFTVKAIDAAGQRVEIQGPDGETRWLQRDR